MPICGKGWIRTSEDFTPSVLQTASFEPLGYLAIGVIDWDRTSTYLIHSQAFCHLNYDHHATVDKIGFEPILLRCKRSVFPLSLLAPIALSGLEPLTSFL